ncbi:variable surface protein [Plasmodium gonderi]|uniref:Variable surface protein n=1 Tax=Plasmodium gonderi TaxID=77519 RepID=A0A1Y1JE44_PLAGO|nr:variable surface protein [Plasmodium gonderi]GAW80801.1 variable surface protein [Plasmodium gonderi]
MSSSGEIPEYDKLLLQSSPSYVIYKKLNEDAGNYKSKCCDILNNSDSNKNDISNLCKKIERNVENLFNISNTIEYYYRCHHYRHWIYENIKKILDNATNDKDKKSISSKFLELRNCIMVNYSVYNCLYDYETDNLSKINDRVEEKYLYDYFYNFDTIKTYEMCNHMNSDKYEQYLNKIIELYNKHKNTYNCCNGSWLHSCFSYFKCNDTFDPEKLLQRLKINGKRSCEVLEKEKIKGSSPDSSTPNKSEPDILSTFYTGPCKSIGEDKLICSLRQVTHKSPKIPLKPSRINNTIDYKSKILPLFSESTDNTISQPSENKHVTSISVSSFVKPLEKKSQSHRDTNELNHEKSDKYKEINTLPIVTLPEGFKWKFGDGSFSCDSRISHEDKYKLCDYVKKLKEGLKELKLTNSTNNESLNTISSTFDSVRDQSHIINYNQGEESLYSTSNGVTYIDSNGYFTNNPEHERVLSNNIFIRVFIGGTLILGMILVFFIYYKFTPFGVFLQRKLSKKKSRKDNEPRKITQKSSLKNTPNKNKNRKNIGYNFAYNSG